MSAKLGLRWGVASALLVIGIADLAVLDLVAAPRWALERGAAAARVTAGTRGTLPAAPPASAPAAPLAAAPTAAAPATAPAPLAASAPAAAPPRVAASSGGPRGPHIRDLRFGSASAELNGRARDKLLRAARALKADDGLQVLLRGHADDRGPEDLNREISRARAQQSADFLVGLGISADRVAVEGVGASQPAVRGQSEAALARNRRVEILWR